MGLFSRKKQPPASATGATSSVTLDDGSSYIVSNIVDCIGDSCPRPQLMTKKAMDGAQSGAVIEVRVDNPTSMEAIPPMMAELGGEHLGTLREERLWRVIVRRN